MLWRKEEKCAQCGTILPKRRNTSSAADAARPICARCALSTIGQTIPDATGPEIDIFLEEVLKTISLKTDVDETLYSARCRTILGSDVEIRRIPRGYDVTFYAGLVSDPTRTKAVVDYIVGWVATHPLTVKPLETRRLGNQTLSPGNLFAFLFIPSSSPMPSDQDIEFMTRQITSTHVGDKFGWLICSQPFDTATENGPFVTETLERWLVDQSDRASIKMVPKPAKTEPGRKLNCLLVYRDKDAPNIQDSRRE